VDADPVWAQPTAASQEPSQAAPPAPAPADDVFAASSRSGDAGDFRSRLAKGAGIPEAALSQKSPHELAEEIGLLMRSTTIL
jgi:predicted component of type VI protein secretion system